LFVKNHVTATEAGTATTKDHRMGARVLFFMGARIGIFAQLQTRGG
jgi:hypothetical protein